jgi:glutathione S-transferase
MPMNIRAALQGKGRGPGVDQDILRITEIWRDCRSAAGSGDFLFGPWCAADAMFAPVASRFRTYAVDLMDETAQLYADAVLGSAWFKEWEAEALKEHWVLPEDEIDMD